MDNKDIHKKIDSDWQNELPFLQKYASKKFYRIIGPLIIGVELDLAPSGNYYPEFLIPASFTS